MNISTKYRLLFLHIGLLAIGCSSGATGTSDDDVAAKATTALTTFSSSSTPASSHHEWRRAMSKTPLPKEGCFQAAQPGTTWVEVPCITPPNVPLLPAHAGSRTGDTVGGGGTGDYSASLPSGKISWAEGSFPSVSYGSGTNNNSYSL